MLRTGLKSKLTPISRSAVTKVVGGRAFTALSMANGSRLLGRGALRPVVSFTSSPPCLYDYRQSCTRYIVREASSSSSSGPSVAKVDPSPVLFKVGVITEVNYHPDADKLYVSKIDIGNNDLRTVISGLTMYFQPENLLNRRVVLVANLKPQKLRGIQSEAMILAAEHIDVLEGNESRTVDSEVGWESIVEERLTTVELVDPPASSAVGDVLHFEGFDGPSSETVKPKLWSHIQADLLLNQSRQVVFKLKDDTAKVTGYSKLVNSEGDPADVATLTEGTVR